MEKEIIETIVKRNKILDEIIQLNDLAISEYDRLSADDVGHFLLTRKYLIEALKLREDEVIALSMLEWSSFKLDEDYRCEYLKLDKEKEDKTIDLLNQDKILFQLMDSALGVRSIA